MINGRSHQYHRDEARNGQSLTNSTTILSPHIRNHPNKPSLLTSQYLALTPPHKFSFHKQQTLFSSPSPHNCGPDLLIHTHSPNPPYSAKPPDPRARSDRTSGSFRARWDALDRWLGKVNCFVILKKRCFWAAVGVRLGVCSAVGEVTSRGRGVVGEERRRGGDGVGGVSESSISSTVMAVGFLLVLSGV
jgi:hypothetical protein